MKLLFYLKKNHHMNFNELIPFYLTLIMQSEANLRWFYIIWPFSLRQIKERVQEFNPWGFSDVLFMTFYFNGLFSGTRGNFTRCVGAKIEMKWSKRCSSQLSVKFESNLSALPPPHDTGESRWRGIRGKCPRGPQRPKFVKICRFSRIKRTLNTFY